MGLADSYETGIWDILVDEMLLMLCVSMCMDGRVRIGGTCGTFLKKQDSKGRGGRGGIEEETSAAECLIGNNAGEEGTAYERKGG
jgi:hypothetical protein